jgi:DNA-binding NtrC family response regulator
MERPVALVVDRDPATRELIQTAFEARDIVARGASSGAETDSALSSSSVGIVVVDVDTPGVDVVDLLGHVTRLQAPPVVIVITRTRDVEREALLTEVGAYDVLQGPLNEARAQLVVLKSLRQVALSVELRELRENLQRREGYHGVVGRSRSIERLRERLSRLAEGNHPVWFWGETGVGKRLVARTLHGESRRSSRRFSVFSCAAVGPDWDGRLVPPGEPLDGLRGATLYLEDIPALAPELQTKLAAALTALDASGDDVRVLASSSEEPLALVERGSLSESLGKRLAVEALSLPPLRDRVEDIPVLAQHFISTICAINHLPMIQLAPEALELLEAYHWPDNVQGLRNAMEQAVILSPDGKIRPRDLPDRLRESIAAPSPRAAGHSTSPRRFRDAKREVVEAFERSYLGGLMERHTGNVTAAAQQAGMLRSALQRLLRKYGLKSAEFRRGRATPEAEESPRPQR